MTTKRAAVRKATKAKSKAKSNGDSLIVGSVEFTNSRGIPTVLRGIPPLAQPLVIEGMENDTEWGKRPEPPTYEMEVAGGEKLIRTHNETTLETDEEKAAWNEYVNQANRWDAELSLRMMDSFLVDGLIVDVPTGKERATWFRRLKMRHIAIPRDDDGEIIEEDLWMLFVKTEVVASKDDAAVIGQTIRVLSGIVIGGGETLEDKVAQEAAAARMFQPDMEKEKSANQTGREDPAE